MILASFRRQLFWVSWVSGVSVSSASSASTKSDEVIRHTSATTLLRLCNEYSNAEHGVVR